MVSGSLCFFSIIGISTVIVKNFTEDIGRQKGKEAKILTGPVVLPVLPKALCCRAHDWSTILTANRFKHEPVPWSRAGAWSGDVPPQEWINFYTKVLSKFARVKGLR